MKKLFSTLFCIAFIINIHSQTLYGTASAGGANGGGTICKLEAGKLSAAFSFDTPDASNPQYSGFIQASNGKLYSMTAYGGKLDAGIIFSYNTATHEYTKIFEFDNVNGALPFGSLIQAKDGKLYGMTYSGGKTSNGVIFSFDINTNTYTKLKDFDSTKGAHPYGSLMQAANGKLYGMTNGGGSSNKGVIFSYNPANNVVTKLIDFTGDNGSQPRGNLMQAIDGKLYGMTAYGGSSGGGVIFSFNLSTSIYTKLKDFTSSLESDGYSSFGSLMQATDGKLYGTTENGGYNRNGVIFSFTISTSAYVKLRDMDYYTDGGYPSGKFLHAKDGKLYGTAYGGSGSGGVVYSFNITTSTYTVIKSFSGLDGRSPICSLMQASDDKVYGMTVYGGSGDIGVIYSLDVVTSAYAKLRDFGINNNGSKIQGNLVKSNTGILYGITKNGGVNGSGVIFSFNPATADYTKLKDLDYINGANAYGGMMQAADGKLYGMTYGGGSNNLGVIFSYNPATSAYNKLIDFNGTNGSYPYGSLMQGSNGKLYGMTSNGGSKGGGVIFSYDPATATYKVILEFDVANRQTTGIFPRGSLIQASDGKLYGMTAEGGNSFFYGVIFSFDINTNVQTKLKDFDFYSGGNPWGSLVQATDGKLYGAPTFGGGIFSYDITTHIYTELKHLTTADGVGPCDRMLQASDGKLYGMTSNGGINDIGVAFSYDPVTSTYTKLQDFSRVTGGSPTYAFFTEVTPSVTLKINNVTKPEGNSGTTNISFTVTLSQAASQTVTVDYKTQNNTAVAPTDYIAKTGTLTFAPGVKKQTIFIAVKGDALVENDEKFKIILSNAVGVTIADSLGIGTIQNDDAGFTSSPIAKMSSNPQPSIKVSPNPASEILNVQLNGYTATVTLQLTDLQGKVLKESKVQTGNIKALQTITIADVASGTYILIASDEQGNKQVKKVVIAH